MGPMGSNVLVGQADFGALMGPMDIDTQVGSVDINIQWAQVA